MESILPGHIKRLAWTLDGKRYTLIMEMPPGFRVFFGPHAPLLLTLAVISSGLVCYLLARSSKLFCRDLGKQLWHVRKAPNGVPRFDQELGTSFQRAAGCTLAASCPSFVLFHAAEGLFHLVVVPGQTRNVVGMEES